LQIILETEYDNSAALSLYSSLGFIREKRLHRFYMNGKDAFRLVLVVNDPIPRLREGDVEDSVKEGRWALMRTIGYFDMWAADLLEKVMGWSLISPHEMVEEEGC
jgi:hypothetical protein